MQLLFVQGAAYTVPLIQMDSARAADRLKSYLLPPRLPLIVLGGGLAAYVVCLLSQTPFAGDRSGPGTTRLFRRAGAACGERH